MVERLYCSLMFLYSHEREGKDMGKIFLQKIPSVRLPLGEPVA